MVPPLMHNLPPIKIPPINNKYKFLKCNSPEKNDKKPNTTPQVNNKICLQCDSSDKLPSDKIALKWTNIPPTRLL